MTLPCGLVGQRDVLDEVVSHLGSGRFVPLVPVVLELGVVPGHGEDLGELGLETEKLLRVLEARNLGGAVDLVHLIRHLVVPDKMGKSL